MKKIFFAILTCFALGSCVDTEILPESKIVDEDYWTTRENVSYFLNNIYKQYLDEEYMRNFIVWTEFRADGTIVNEALTGSKKDDMDEIGSLTTKSDNSYLSWSNLYTIINNCNILIEKAGDVMNIDPNYTKGFYDSDISQAKALRSLAYFNLIRCFRDVPMSTEAYLSSSQVQPKEQVAPGTILDYCITSALEAQNGSLAASGYEASDPMRFTRFTDEAIWALLADLHLWKASVMHSTADYEECVKYCDKIIEGRHAIYQNIYRDCKKEDMYWMPKGTYLLDFSGNTGSPDVIYAVTAINNTNPGMCQMYNQLEEKKTYPTLRVPAYIKQIGSAETNVFTTENDRRRGYTLKEDNSDTYLIGKQINAAYKNYNQNWNVYRLPDIILMKAEAETQLGNLDEAYTAVKAVWDYAMTQEEDLVKPSNVDDMEKLVLAERMRELCFEGKRWFDLLRYNYRHVEGVDYYTTMTSQASHAPTYDKMRDLACRKYSNGAAIAAKMQTEPYLYMPIMQSEIDVNNALIQNPVYKAATTLK